jgi:protein FRA10AC1
MDAWNKHRRLIQEYKTYYGDSACNSIYERHGVRGDLMSPHVTEGDILRTHHRFVFDDDDDNQESTWNQRVARYYYDQLFKEYAIADLSRYQQRQIALRWRIEKEVMDGKGQFICGEQHCQASTGLKSWEVNFTYSEQGKIKHTLVKVRLCHECTQKLHRIQNKKEKHDDSREEMTKELCKTLSLQKEAPSTDERPHKVDPWKIQRETTEKTQEEEFEEYLGDLLL